MQERKSAEQELGGKILGQTNTLDFKQGKLLQRACLKLYFAESGFFKPHV